jgi:hypothetical protein
MTLSMPTGLKFAPLCWKDYGNKYGFIGFNRAGNPIEVFYNPIGDDIIKVFHAMGCRNGIFAQIES